jgi:trk/ktr system potassium uptake protein
MASEGENKMKIMIVGGGKVGAYLAAFLIKEGYEVKLIEMRKEEIPQLLRDLPADVVVHGNGTDPNVLEAAGIHTVDVLAPVTGVDEVNLVIANLARFEFDVPRIIARVNHPKNVWMFTPEMGVDVALNQADLLGSLIVEEMSLGDMMTLLKLRKGQYSLVVEKVAPTAIAIGMKLQDLHLPDQCVIAAVIRDGELFVPHDESVLQEMDEIIALARTDQKKQLALFLDKQAL